MQENSFVSEVDSANDHSSDLYVDDPSLLALSQRIKDKDFISSSDQSISAPSIHSTSRCSSLWEDDFLSNLLALLTMRIFFFSLMIIP